MAEPEQTQKSGTSASAVSASSEDTPSKAGSESPQTAQATQVEDSTAEDKSTPSDGADGAASDGVRRKGRQERRISELTTKIKELENERAKQSQLSEALNKTPIGDVNVPDFTNRENITYEDYKKDVITAASQIVDLKLQTTANVLESKLTTQNAAERAAREIETAENRYNVLNPRSEDYDEDLVHDITEQYSKVFSQDPNFSFTEFIKPMSRFLSNTTSQDTTESESRSRGTQANRATSGGSRKSTNAFPEGGTAQEMEAWFATRRG